MLVGLVPTGQPASKALVFVAELPFVDRGGLLAGILKMTKAVLESAQDSFEPQRAIVVKAPEGAGKSRLMAELAQAVQAESIFLISASCWGDGTSSVEGLQKMVLELAERLGPDSKAVSEHAELIELSGGSEPTAPAALGASQSELRTGIRRYRAAMWRNLPHPSTKHPGP